MQLQTILNRVARHSSFVYGTPRWVDDPLRPTLEVPIRPRANGRAVCSGCGQRRPGYDRLDERRFEFVPLWQIAVVFVYSMRRVACPRCGVTVERVPWSSGKSRLTIDYQWFLARWARRLSWLEVAAVFHTTWEHVREQTVKLAELLRYNLQSVRAYLLREDFQRFWEYHSPIWAGKFLDEWSARVLARGWSRSRRWPAVCASTAACCSTGSTPEALSRPESSRDSTTRPN